MLRWFRAGSRPLAAAILVAFVGLGGLSTASHGTDCHDEECSAAAPHDPDAHRITAPDAATSHPLHCVLCHWSRSTRPSTETTHHLISPAADDVRPHAEVTGTPSPAQAAQPPLRSPPLV